MFSASVRVAATRSMATITVALLGLLPASYASELAAIDAAAERVAAKLQVAGKLRVAVLDFSGLDGKTSELGRYLSNEFAASLISRGSRMQVLDRANINKILREQGLQERGLVEPSNVLRFGKLFSAAQALGVGTIAAIGESYRVTIQFSAVDTAAVVALERLEVPITPALRTLERKPISAGVRSGDAISQPLQASALGDGDGYRLNVRDISSPIAGQASIQVVHESLRRSYDVAVLRPQTYLVDKAGVQHQMVRASNIASVGDLDVMANDVTTKEFPRGIGIRYTLIFRAPEDLAGTSLVVTYVEPQRNGARPKLTSASLGPVVVR